METGRVLRRQLERDRQAPKFYATKYSLMQCKYSTLGTSLHIVSMDLATLNCLYLFLYALGRLGGAFGVHEMLIGLLECENLILTRGYIPEKPKRFPGFWNMRWDADHIRAGSTPGR